MDRCIFFYKVETTLVGRSHGVLVDGEKVDALLGWCTLQKEQGWCVFVLFVHHNTDMAIDLIRQHKPGMFHLFIVGSTINGL